MKQPLLGLTLTELQVVVKNLGMPGFAAKQIASWLYDKKAASIDEMTNLSLKHRELLKEIYEVGGEAPVDAMRSADGTVKYLYRVGEGHYVEAVYIPDDAGMKYYDMQKLLNYVPRYRTVLKSEELSTVDENNWKHCFVINKLDHMIYTVMWKGQLVRINPKNRTAEILLKKISNVATGDGGKAGSDSYIAFSPIKGEENVLYVSLADFHQIWRVDVSKITPEDKDTYNGESYAGKAIYEGVMNGKGWEDGLLKNAKFRHPRQICFTDDGKMYIADSGNSCIRVIDTTMPKERAAVTTPIGLPGAEGYKDGGPEIAKFHFPCGVAVNSDGTIVYVADTQNKVIRKLSIE